MKYRRLPPRPRVVTPLPLALRQRNRRKLGALARARFWVGTLADIVQRIAREAREAMN